MVEQAVGVSGADMACPNTAVPGKCGFPLLLDALITCGSLPACTAIVHYFRGLDGCSAPVSMLASRPLTSATTFVSPLVATFSELEQGNAEV